MNADSYLSPDGEGGGCHLQRQSGRLTSWSDEVVTWWVNDTIALAGRYEVLLLSLGSSLNSSSSNSVEGGGGVNEWDDKVDWCTVDWTQG
jgi:hypothetical protein